MDKDKKVFFFKLRGKAQIQRDFTLEDGIVSGTLKLGKRTLHLQFEQK